MSVNTAAAAAYLVAALLFIRALAGLSKHETAKAGNNFGIVGHGKHLVDPGVLPGGRLGPDVGTTGHYGGHGWGP